MDHLSYWQRQEPDTPLFPDIEWNKPEQRLQAGKLGIIGGNSLGFAAVGEAYQTALETGAGNARALLPDKLRSSVPSHITDVLFGASNPSGGLSSDALLMMDTLGAWTSNILLVGDAGKNSETAILYERFAHKYQGQLTITRDAVDLYSSGFDTLVERDKTLLVVSFSQLQSIFRGTYYPKILTFSMHLQQLVEALHKFTITYPAMIMTFHQNQLIVAARGSVTTTPWDQPMAIWRGSVATKAACYLMWSPNQPLEALTASIVAKS